MSINKCMEVWGGLRIWNRATSLVTNASPLPSCLAKEESSLILSPGVHLSEGDNGADGGVASVVPGGSICTLTLGHKVPSHPFQIDSVDTPRLTLSHQNVAISAVELLCTFCTGITPGRDADRFLVQGE